MASTYNGTVSNERWENLRRADADEGINVGNTERLVSGLAAGGSGSGHSCFPSRAVSFLARSPAAARSTARWAGTPPAGERSARSRASTAERESR